MIIVERIYDSKSNGLRILVDRIWPRGLKKEKARIDLWAREIAPSDELRKWFSHDPEKWNEFLIKYENELLKSSKFKDFLDELKKVKGDIIFLYSSREEKYNNANALKIIVEKYL